MADVAPSLQNDRRLILNPFSHDDVETPFYRQELENLIVELERLTNIEKTIIIGIQEIRQPNYQVKVHNGEYEHTATIGFTESFIKLEYDGQIYFSNPKVKIYSSSDERRIPLKECTLNTLFGWVYNAVSLRKETAPPIKNCIYNNVTGEVLID